MEPERCATRSDRLDRFGDRCARRGTAFAARRSLESREEHLPDGAGLEPRDDCLRVRGQLRAASRRPQRRWPRRSRLRNRWRGAARHDVSVARARLGARRVLPGGILGSVFGVVLGGFIAERWGWQTGFGVVGIPAFCLRSCSLPACAITRRSRCL
jgi:hypothetical protein